MPIVKGQIALEKEGFKKANKVIFCDTDILETSVYSAAYFNNKVPKALERLLEENNADLYFLTFIDTPWTPDDLRDKPNERKFMFSLFKKAIHQTKKPYIVLKGDQRSRFIFAKKHVDQLIQSH